MNILQATDIGVELANRRVLEKISLTVDAGELIGLVGPNGSGKTTCLRALLGLVPIDHGSITLDGRTIKDVQRRELAQRVAYLPQGGNAHWPLTVARVVALGRLPHRPSWQRLRDVDRDAIHQAMEDADIAHLADRVITTLSGGELMLVHIARVLAGAPAVIVADEPTAALDPFHQLQVMELLRSIAHQGGAVLVVLHELSLATRYCDRLVLLDEGKVVAQGKPADVLTTDNVASAYRIEALHRDEQGESYVLPWRMQNGSREVNAPLTPTPLPRERG